MIFVITVLCCHFFEIAVKLLFRIKTLLIAILVAMILMRLIWVEVRDHKAVLDIKSFFGIEALNRKLGDICDLPKGVRVSTIDTLPAIEGAPLGVQQSELSEGFTWIVKKACISGQFQSQHLISYYKNTLLLAVFLAGVLGRVLTGGWLSSAIICAMLLSRGRYLSTVGYISPTCIISALMMCVFLFCTHFIRTGYWLSFMLLWVFLGFALFFEASFFLVGFAFIFLLFLGMIHDLIVAPPQQDTQQNQRSGSVYRFFNLTKSDWNIDPYLSGRVLVPIGIPITRWLRVRRRWLGFGIIAGLWTFLLFFIGLNSFPINALELMEKINLVIISNSFGHIYNGWVAVWLRMVDLDMGVSLIIVLIGAVLPRKFSHPGVTEACFAFYAMFFVTALGAFSIDLVELTLASPLVFSRYMEHWLRAAQVILWFEPLCLTLGIVGILNIIRIVLNFSGLNNKQL